MSPPGRTFREARCVWAANAALGEAPLWMAAEDALYWVDIIGGRVLRYYVESGRRETCTMPEAVSALAPMADGRLLCTSRRAIHAFDARSGRLAPLAHPDFPAHDIRINDGCAHADGAFWFGTMDLGERAAVGDFYRLSPEGACERLPAGFVITNGPAFSPDGGLGYFVDSVGRRILRAPLENGLLAAAPRLFAALAVEDGSPDGLAVDAEGGVWCAHWGGGRITRFDAGGRISDTVRLPVSNVTKCAFGGRRLDRLFVTTARKGLDDGALTAEPLAGGLFEVEVDYPGLPPQSYRGTASDAASRTCVFDAT
jgi:xylono-1,5-lactonase